MISAALLLATLGQPAVRPVDLGARMREVSCSHADRCPSRLEITSAVRRFDADRYKQIIDRHSADGRELVIHGLRFDGVQDIHCAQEDEPTLASCKFTAVWGGTRLEHFVATFELRNDAWQLADANSVVQDR